MSDPVSGTTVAAGGLMGASVLVSQLVLIMAWCLALSQELCST